MFEKDADYRKARKESRESIVKVIKVWSAREVAIHNKGFKDGAEFGYNKCFEQIRKIVNEHTRLDCIIPELLRLQEAVTAPLSKERKEE